MHIYKVSTFWTWLCTTDEKPATSCCLIDSLDFISLILKNIHLQGMVQMFFLLVKSWLFNELNIRITYILLVILQDEHLLDWSDLGISAKN